MFLPCPFQNCFFCGDKLFRHLQSRHHKMSKEKSALFHSYLIRYVDYYSLICKSPKHSPQICIKCNRFYLRIDSHIEYTHQLKRNSNEFKHAISKRRRHTQQFGLNYLAEIQKTELVQNEPVLTQELENINVKSKKIISTIKSTSTITHPTSNKPSTSSFGNEPVNSENLGNVNLKSKHRQPKPTSTITCPNSNVPSSANAVTKCLEKISSSSKSVKTYLSKSTSSEIRMR